MKKVKGWKHEREFDTRTILSDMGPIDENIHTDSTEPQADDSKETRKAVDLKTLSDAENQSSEGKVTQVYEPRPLTPEDDIYEDIIEQFASAPTKPKYWFEEFGDYWSCSCGHINKGDTCKSCGLERELLRSLFILHKPAGSPGKLNKKLNKATKEQIEKEEQRLAAQESRRKQREAEGHDGLTVVPIETDSSQRLETSELSQDVASDTESPEASDSHPDTESSEDTALQEQDSDISAEAGGKADTKEKAESDNSETCEETAPDASELHEARSDDMPVSQKSQDIALPALLPQAKEDAPSKKKTKAFRIKLIAAIVACLLLIGGGGVVIYHYLAAPAMQYEEAMKLQADGKYEKAIEKYKALGDYKDCKRLIWECYCSIGDEYFKAGEFNKAIDTYNIALDLKDDEKVHDKIWQAYLGIGDRHLSEGKYEDALSTYYVAADLKDNETVQDKINSAKFGYVKTYQSDRTARVEEYMSDLMSIKYPGIQDIYDKYYAWHVKIIANTSEGDYSNDVDTFSRKDTVYFHVLLSGGEPSEQIMFYYEVTWPNGVSQIYNLESSWQNGSKITARFQYPIPLFGKEGKLVFKLYDKSTGEEMGSDTISFKN